MNENITILKNVLVNTGGNKFQLCDIYCDTKIREIKYQDERQIDWIDIRKKEQKENVLKEFMSKEEAKKVFVAIPGGIDPHVHFNTPGFEFREDFEHASQAAISGGTTCIIDMPCTSIPPVTSVQNMKIKLDSLKNWSYVDYLFWGGVSGCDFHKKEVEKNIAELAEAGVCGFKVYLISGMDTYADLDDEKIEFVAKTIVKTGKPMAVHAEDKEMVSFRERRFKTMERNDWKAYCESRDVQAEAEAVNKLIAIAKRTGCKIHVVHLSSELALRSIENAQADGIPITTETCPHYLHFTQNDFENESIRNFLKTAPPVKFEVDRKALWQGLDDGTISFVTTDHAGCSPSEEKVSENFWEVYGGIPGVEHRMIYLLSEGFKKGRLTFEKVVSLLSTNAAEFFGLKSKGKIKKGLDADIVLVDLWNSHIIKSSEMHSKGKYTPFENLGIDTVVGEVFLRGKQVVRNKILFHETLGHFIRNN